MSDTTPLTDRVTTDGTASDGEDQLEAALVSRDSSSEKSPGTGVAALLSLLHVGIPDEDAQTLADVTMLRVQRTARPTGDVLSVGDAAACDELVEAGFDLSACDPEHRDRCACHAALAGAVVSADVPEAGRSASELGDAVLARIEANTSATRDRIPFALGSRWQLADIGSLAAMLLIGASIVMTVMPSLRGTSRVAACFGHMQNVASAMGMYAIGNDGGLPVAQAGFGGSWMNVGTPRQSNSENLFMLIKTDHADVEDLACPGNPAAPTSASRRHESDWRRLEEVSYSYQVMSAGVRPVWNQPNRAVVIADRSPVILRAARGEPINPYENSPNHGGTGQHVIFLDGSASWSASATVAGDNIWLPRPIERIINDVRDQVREQHGLIRGDEIPESAQDSFLAP